MDGIIWMGHGVCNDERGLLKSCTWMNSPAPGWWAFTCKVSFPGSLAKDHAEYVCSTGYPRQRRPGSWTHTWCVNVCGGTEEQICPAASLGRGLPCCPSPAIRLTPEVLQLYSAQRSCRQACILRNKPKEKTDRWTQTHRNYQGEATEEVESGFSWVRVEEK